MNDETAAKSDSTGIWVILAASVDMRCDFGGIVVCSVSESDLDRSEHNWVTTNKMRVVRPENGVDVCPSVPSFPFTHTLPSLPPMTQYSR